MQGAPSTDLHRARPAQIYTGRGGAPYIIDESMDNLCGARPAQMCTGRALYKLSNPLSIGAGRACTDWYKARPVQNYQSMDSLCRARPAQRDVYQRTGRALYKFTNPWMIFAGETEMDGTAVVDDRMGAEVGHGVMRYVTYLCQLRSTLNEHAFEIYSMN